MKTFARTRKFGGSIVVTLPKEIIKEENNQEENLWERDIQKTKKNYFGLLKGMKKFTKKDEFT